MPDRLVKLYELASIGGLVPTFADRGVILRRATAPEKHPVVT